MEWGEGSSHGDFCFANLHLSSPRSVGLLLLLSSRFFPPRVDSRIRGGGDRSITSKLILSLVSRWWINGRLLSKYRALNRRGEREGIERNETKRSEFVPFVLRDVACVYITPRSYAPRDNYRVTCLSLSRLRSPFLRGRLTSSPPRLDILPKGLRVLLQPLPPSHPIPFFSSSFFRFSSELGTLMPSYPTI